MNSTVFTGHKNAANVTPQQKHTKFLKKVLALSRLFCVKVLFKFVDF